jgi:hypothetical protein
VRKFLVLCSLALLLVAVGCGGGSSSNSNGNSSSSGSNTIAALSASNVAPVVVDGGPVSGVIQQNLAYTTVTICVPGSTTNCQTINHVQIDTGSSGLRMVGSQLSTVGPQLTNVNGTGSPLAECTQFLDGTFMWGAVKYADVYMGGPNNNGELAHSVPILVTQDSSVPSAPGNCATGPDDSSQAGLGANGLLGVGTLQYDCDVLGGSNACVTQIPSAMYYTCNSGNCSGSVAALNQQLRNPVSLFATDNNGVILELPAVGVGGQATAVQGALVFGIGTQANNGLGSAAVLTIDTNLAGYIADTDANYMGITTGFNGNSYPGSFLDSGSSANFFLDQAESGISACIVEGAPYYCPSSTQSHTATNQGTNGANHTIQFSVTSGATLVPSDNVAFSDLAAPNSSSTQALADDEFFDWGLSFFYGRNVYTSIYNVNSQGAFWAWLP